MRQRKRNTGRNPSAGELANAKRIAALDPESQMAHPTAVKAERERLSHINTCCALPAFYIDQPFKCRECGKEEIWRAADQKWYYEEAKGHIDAIAVHCHDCRATRRTRGKQ